MSEFKQAEQALTLPPSLALKKLRAESDISQAELAKYCNVSQVTIMRWEKGASAISEDGAARLAQFFNVPQYTFCSNTNRLEDETFKMVLEHMRIYDESSGGLMADTSVLNKIPLSRETFGVSVDTDAMTCATRAIPRGSIALVTPIKTMKDYVRRVVYGTFDGKYYIIKELCHDGANYFLRPWNEQYPVDRDLTDFKIKGVVVGYFKPV